MEVVGRADEALLPAKEGGRDLVVLAKARHDAGPSGSNGSALVAVPGLQPDGTTGI